MAFGTPENNTTIENNDNLSNTKEELKKLKKEIEQSLSHNKENNYLLPKNLKNAGMKIPELQKELDSNTTKTEASLDDLKRELVANTYQAKVLEKTIENEVLEINPDNNVGINEDNLPIDENGEEISVADIWPEGIPEGLEK